MLRDSLDLNWSSTLGLHPRFQIVLPPGEWLIIFSLKEHSTTHRIHNNSSHKEHSTRPRNSHDTFLSLIKDIKYNVQPQTFTNSSSLGVRLDWPFGHFDHHFHFEIDPNAFGPSLFWNAFWNKMKMHVFWNRCFNFEMDNPKSHFRVHFKMLMKMLSKCPQNTV